MLYPVFDFNAPPQFGGSGTGRPFSGSTLQDLDSSPPFYRGANPSWRENPKLAERLRASIETSGATMSKNSTKRIMANLTGPRGNS